ncbi:hypothetical protein HYH03_011867 [Edaphochlamys debaryana]|uniref:FHA domain-containing protein n=1 Tax=Edaphochlamys debaryana TaxID=47281 RepID=A0A835XT24_9CHLO|nr:hypothetical protein HYH03_011867 [Edaphochlamys debaryana]|eukprot:KAG2489586.1 hypothetical protein HYH03_011867 [Edaphochlamys debaryana]
MVWRLGLELNAVRQEGGFTLTAGPVPGGAEGAEGAGAASTPREVTVGRPPPKAKSGAEGAFCPDLVVPEKSVSKVHCVLRVELGGEGPASLVLEDRSRFGTTINGAKLASGGSQRLAPGDRVQLAPRTFLTVEDQAVVVAVAPRHPRLEELAEAARRAGVKLVHEYDSSTVSYVLYDDGDVAWLGLVAGVLGGTPLASTQWLTELADLGFAAGPPPEPPQPPGLQLGPAGPGSHPGPAGPGGARAPLPPAVLAEAESRGAGVGGLLAGLSFGHSESWQDPGLARLLSSLGGRVVARPPYKGRGGGGGGGGVLVLTEEAGVAGADGGAMGVGRLLTLLLTAASAAALWAALQPRTVAAAAAAALPPTQPAAGAALAPTLEAKVEEEVDLIEDSDVTQGPEDMEEDGEEVAGGGGGGGGGAQPPVAPAPAPAAHAHPAAAAVKPGSAAAAAPAAAAGPGPDGWMAIVRRSDEHEPMANAAAAAPEAAAPPPVDESAPPAKRRRLGLAGSLGLKGTHPGTAAAAAAGTQAPITAFVARGGRSGSGSGAAGPSAAAAAARAPPPPTPPPAGTAAAADGNEDDTGVPWMTQPANRGGGGGGGARTPAGASLGACAALAMARAAVKPEPQDGPPAGGRQAAAAATPAAGAAAGGTQKRGAAAKGGKGRGKAAAAADDPFDILGAAAHVRSSKDDAVQDVADASAQEVVEVALVAPTSPDPPAAPPASLGNGSGSHAGSESMAGSGPNGSGGSIVAWDGAQGGPNFKRFRKAGAQLPAQPVWQPLRTYVVDNFQRSADNEEFLRQEEERARLKRSAEELFAAAGGGGAGGKKPPRAPRRG